MKNPQFQHNKEQFGFLYAIGENQKNKKMVKRSIRNGSLGDKTYNALKTLAPRMTAMQQKYYRFITEQAKKDNKMSGLFRLIGKFTFGEIEIVETPPKKATNSTPPRKLKLGKFKKNTISNKYYYIVNSDLEKYYADAENQVFDSDKKMMEETRRKFGNDMVAAAELFPDEYRSRPDQYKTVLDQKKREVVNMADGTTSRDPYIAYKGNVYQNPNYVPNASPAPTEEEPFLSPDPTILNQFHPDQPTSPAADPVADEPFYVQPQPIGYRDTEIGLPHPIYEADYTPVPEEQSTPQPLTMSGEEPTPIEITGTNNSNAVPNSPTDEDVQTSELQISEAVKAKKEAEQALNSKQREINELKAQLEREKQAAAEREKQAAAEREIIIQRNKELRNKVLQEARDIALQTQQMDQEAAQLKAELERYKTTQINQQSNNAPNYTSPANMVSNPTNTPIKVVPRRR